MRIRIATSEDAKAIHELHTISVTKLCSKSYEPEIIHGWLEGRTPQGYKGILKNEMYVLEEKGQIAGFSHVVPGEIVAIFVHPEFIRKGIGSALVKHAAKIAKTNWNGPVKIDSTLNAEPFYESLGFVRIGEQQGKRNNIFLRVINMKLD